MRTDVTFKRQITTCKHNKTRDEHSHLHFLDGKIHATRQLKTGNTFLGRLFSNMLKLVLLFLFIAAACASHTENANLAIPETVTSMGLHLPSQQVKVLPWAMSMLHWTLSTIL